MHFLSRVSLPTGVILMGRSNTHKSAIHLVSTLTLIHACPYKTLRVAPHPSTAYLCRSLLEAQAAGLSNDTLFVDVGAARAHQTILARAFGHPVLALECRADEYRTLSKRFEGDPRILLLNTCASDLPGNMTMYRAADSSSLHAEKVAHGAEKRKASHEKVKSELVRVEQLDTVLSTAFRHLGMRRVGFIKVDTQGHEAEVLRGASLAIAKDSPFLFYEDMFTTSALRNGRLPSNITSTPYSCQCDRMDCFCRPQNHTAFLPT